MRDSTGTTLCASISSSAAARPRSTSSGGAMPRRQRPQLGDGLAGLGQRLVDGRGGPLRVVGDLALGAAEVHGQPDQPLLRAVVDVALEPAHRLGLRDPGGVAAALDAGHLVLQLGAAAQQHPGQAGVHGRRPAGPPTAG